MGQSHLFKSVLQTGRQHTKTILHAPPEIYGRSFGEVLGWAGYFTDSESKVHTLRQHLVIENEVVRVLQQRHSGKHRTAEGAIAGVVFREFCSYKQVLHKGQDRGLQRTCKTAFLRQAHRLQ